MRGKRTMCGMPYRGRHAGIAAWTSLRSRTRTVGTRAAVGAFPQILTLTPQREYHHFDTGTTDALFSTAVNKQQCDRKLHVSAADQLYVPGLKLIRTLVCVLHCPEQLLYVFCPARSR